MRKSVMALIGAGLAVAAVGVSAPAQAQHYHHGFGPGIAAGLLGGALLGGALASPYYGPGYYGYGPRYYGPGYGPAYVADEAPYGPCYWQRQRFWDGYGWRIRRVRVCG